MYIQKTHPSLPPEIWEHIALYLSKRETANASCLSPALANIAEGHKYRALSIPLHFQDITPSKGTIEKEAKAALMKLKDEKHAHYIQAVYLTCAPPLSTTEQISVQLGSMFLGTKKLDPTLLNDFTSIKELHLNSFDGHLPAALPFVDMDRHPFTFLVWNHTWTGLVHLSITADLNLCRICQMLPSAAFAEFPLPRLELMRLKMNVIFWDRENAAAIVRHISHFYLGSKTLRSLDLRFLIVQPDVLSSLLPSHPEEQFPRLEIFGFKATYTEEQEHLRWIPILGTFLVAHKDTLEVLHVTDVPASDILAPLLLSVQDSISDVRLDIDVDDFHEFKELVHPRSEIARFICRTLRRLHIPNTLSYETWDHLVQLFSLSGRTPHLTTLRLSVDLLSFGLLTSLAISFPNLDTLHLKIRQSYSHQNKIAFISQFRKHSPNDPFSSWKLRDISLVHDIDDVRLRREKEIMNEIAALIPSISSFNGSGDMF